jgi:hypothetical protein
MSEESEILTAILVELKAIHDILDAISDYGTNNSIGDVCGKLDDLGRTMGFIDLNLDLLNAKM